ncbi:glycosyltransferase [Cellulomonas sp. Leaf395]|uniref:glycosyltransferase n=1 Tax=Cellulomonas sp. Leaf395 TaxID=1736362 RepID=UPI0006F83FC6|nr:glycosyltransferase [Cellulomonas sp. Leaf395]KQS99772.1 glycosyl transferase family 1 [Cellulomonas sp. Leaf395]
MGQVRIVVVSAHYPPNLTSGGTLVPQRIARGLASRGHDVRVFAGHLDDSRAPLSSWDETGEDGIPVRWLSITPFTSWSDPLNSLNPGAEQAFESWLDENSADVVHLHSLQTMGAGLVSVAKRSGAQVVVTMHDFWWTCARQFLVAPDMTPCSLVVSCGACPCAVNHEWLAARNRALHARLADADLVLAPSRSAAEVMIANGVDERRVRVDENGLPEKRRTTAERREDQDVRFMFAGGADPMKGLPVLLEALRAVPAGGWLIDLYGVDAAHTDGLGTHVRAQPAYRPVELDDVLGAHDVLILPSVMRESHSILTREALGAGLAVVCTDTLGPEEAVRDGVNGLVVPAADARGLTVALTGLVQDRDQVRRMQEVAVDVQVRALEDQVVGLEATYGALLAASTDVVEPEPIMHRVLFVVGIQGAPLRYRAHLPAESLRELGIATDVRHYRDPELPVLAATADAVVIYRVPATVQVLDLVRQVRARQRRVPVLFDVDDLIVDPGLRGSVHGLEGLSGAERDLWWNGVARYRTTLEAADAYIGSTEALCDEVGRLTGMPVHRFANGVGAALGRLSEEALTRQRRQGPLRIGYFSGTTTHDADWAVVEPAVVEVMRRHSDVELWLGGHLGTGAALDEVADRVHRLPMLPWTQLPARLRDVDVNLAPLVADSQFNEAKSAIKWLEAALVATPTVASPREPFRESIDDGVTGHLASTHEEWVEALELLLTDEHHRTLVGSRARRAALLRWSPAHQGHRYREILLAAARDVRGQENRRQSSWVAVAGDEPLSAADAWVDEYPPRTGSPAGPWRMRSAAIRRVYRSGGITAVAARARRRLSQRG